jgi:CHAT domain-containing protein
MPRQLVEPSVVDRIVLIRSRSVHRTASGRVFGVSERETEGSLTRRGILRTLKIDSPRKPMPTGSRHALVIGEPLVADVPPLPGARLEAERVGQKLMNCGVTATVLNNAGPEECFRALFAEEYCIVHAAAHGCFEESNPKNSGVILGSGLRLTAREFQNLRATPSLVFLNCCHLGGLSLTNPGH